MQIDLPTTNQIKAPGLKIAIIISTYNYSIGEQLLNSCTEYLKASEVEFQILKVPGALEIPLLASKIAKQGECNVIITLGIVIKGETLHFEIVSFESHRALMDISLRYEIPIIFGIICANNKEQAMDRAAPDKLNKGKEFAIAAIRMALLNNKKTHD